MGKVNTPAAKGRTSSTSSGNAFNSSTRRRRQNSALTSTPISNGNFDLSSSDLVANTTPITRHKSQPLWPPSSLYKSDRNGDIVVNGSPSMLGGASDSLSLLNAAAINSGGGSSAAPGAGVGLDAPVHSAKESLFSTASGFTHYRGFFNLCILLLVLSNARVAIENILKYGILIDPFDWFTLFVAEPYHWPMTSLICLSVVFIGFTLLIERLLAARWIGEWLGFGLHFLNLGVVLVLPAAIILALRPSPVASSACLSVYSVVFLKLVSYVQVNYWYRTAALQLAAKQSTPTTAAGHKRKKSDQKHTPIHHILSPKKQHPQANGSITFESKQFAATSTNNSAIEASSFSVQRERSLDTTPEAISYPQNLTVENLAYLIVVPTLCYELNFPRTRRVHKWFVAKRLLEAVFLIQVVLGLCQQWILPLLRNSVAPFIQMDYGHMLERLLKLAVPNHVIWLIAFYWLFHSCLNLLAELFRFADREFYLDWWNSETIGRFWKTWNVPVHRWCVRHCYKPLIRAGYNSLQAGMAVFFVSAFFHEYLVSIPLHMFRFWAFGGMLAQMPLNIVASRLLRGKSGNMAVWLSLILGQPLCILMYLHDFYVLNYVNGNQTTIVVTESIETVTVPYVPF